MLILILVEIALLAGSVFGGGLISYMENNEIEVLHERVLNRQRYLQNEMLTRWSKVDSTAIKINQMTEELLQEGSISIDTLDDSSKDCFALMDSVIGSLINMLRNNKVTGAFIVLNTDIWRNLQKKEYTKTNRESMSGTMIPSPAIPTETPIFCWNMHRQRSSRT